MTKKPNLDRLVGRGTTFTHAYNMGAWGGAVCVASRAMLVTGRTVWRAKAGEKNQPQEVEAGRLWPQRMAAAGYETYFTGKWHIQADAAKCFTHNIHKRPGMPKDEPEGYNRPLPGKPDPWNPGDPKFGGFWQGGKHWSEVLGDDSVAFLGQAAKSEKPFFMYLAFNAPHDPRQSPKAYVDRYPLDRIKVPDNFLPEYPQKEAIGAGKNLRDEKLAPFPRDENSVKVNRQEYYAIITHMDAQIGRILDAPIYLQDAMATALDLAADPAMVGRKRALFAKFRELQERYHDKLDLVAIFPELKQPPRPTLALPLSYAAELLAMGPAGYWQFEEIREGVVADEVPDGARRVAAGTAAIVSESAGNHSGELTRRTQAEYFQIPNRTRPMLQGDFSFGLFAQFGWLQNFALLSATRSSGTTSPPPARATSSRSISTASGSAAKPWDRCRWTARRSSVGRLNGNASQPRMEARRLVGHLDELAIFPAPSASRSFRSSRSP
jgi:hypothetical protein